jgi:hypothetical protein
VSQKKPVAFFRVVWPASRYIGNSWEAHALCFQALVVCESARVIREFASWGHQALDAPGVRHVSRPLTEAEKNAAKFPPTKTIAEHILTNAQDSRPVVQDFVPLADSLEWELGQQYLRDRGNKAFISDASPVPFVVNNDGNLLRNAAEVFFTSLLEADKAGDLEPDIHVLELGIGVGLFARFFLDHFEQLCDKHKKDFYERLTYVAAD